jgi:hypothetical protein
MDKIIWFTSTENQYFDTDTDVTPFKCCLQIRAETDSLNRPQLMYWIIYSHLSDDVVDDLVYLLPD